MSLSSTSSYSPAPAFAALFPVVLAVFLAFLAVSIPLGALPLELGKLGFGPAIIGSVIGLQSLATLIIRHQAGALCDRRGPRRAALIGLPQASVSGLAYLLSSILPVGISGKLACLIAARLLMGLGESLFLTGLISLGIARLGADRTGRVMSWTGIAIYAALGLGAPLGLAAQATYGFLGVGVIATLTPLLALAIVLRIAPTPSSGGQRVPFHHVLGLIWRPGLVLALSMVPFAVIAAFLPLHFAAQGWPQAGTALFGFGTAYVLVRLAGSGWPDRFGAASVAIGSLAFELIGQLVLWLAPSPSVAMLGAILTGLGFSLIFPAMGVLATRSVPANQRGQAVGNYIAFADIALGVTGPAVGFATQWAGIAAAFITGAAATCAALALLSVLRSKTV